MISITDSIAIIMNNEVTSNGSFDYGMPLSSVNNGAAILESNTLSQLYCSSTCIASVQSAQAQINNNTMSFIVGSAFFLNASSLVLQD